MNILLPLRQLNLNGSVFHVISSIQTPEDSMFNELYINGEQESVGR